MPAAAPDGCDSVKAGDEQTDRRDFPVVRNGGIWDYSDDDLRLAVRWVKSDGQNRGDDQLLVDTMHELGFKRRGSTISDRLGRAIEAER